MVLSDLSEEGEGLLQVLLQEHVVFVVVVEGSGQISDQRAVFLRVLHPGPGARPSARESASHIRTNARCFCRGPDHRGMDRTDNVTTTTTASGARACVCQCTNTQTLTHIHSLTHSHTHTHGLFPLTGPMSARLGNTHSRGPGLRFAAVWQLFSPAYERRSSIIPVFASQMLHFSARIREFCAASRRRRCCPSIWREERSGGGAPLVHDGKCSSLSVANINKVRYKKIHVNIY